MASVSIKFKRLLFGNSQDDRRQILLALKDWLTKQIPHDPSASACYATIQDAYQLNSWASNKEFKSHYMWDILSNYDNCPSFQEIVKSKLAVPKTNIAVIVKDVNAGPRKAIPKKIRGEAWKACFGDSTNGACYCCKKELDVFDDWHAGHIVSHSNGGADTADNLRPVCGSCNLSMATENMDEFKERCYPSL
jgi:hypothetical protein